MDGENDHKTHFRYKGHITAPPEIRSLLKTNEGDDLYEVVIPDSLLRG